MAKETALMQRYTDYNDRLKARGIQHQGATTWRKSSPTGTGPS